MKTLPCEPSREGWHFLAQDRKLRYDDKRLVEVGVPLASSKEPKLCHSGMHASPTLLAALSYAPGLVACKVLVTGVAEDDGTKFVGRERVVLEMADMLPVIVEFAKWCAERAKKHAYADAAAYAAAYAADADAAAAAAADAAVYAERSLQEIKLQELFYRQLALGT